MPTDGNATAWGVAGWCIIVFAVAVLVVLGSCHPAPRRTWPARDNANHRLTCHLERNGVACGPDSTNATR